MHLLDSDFRITLVFFFLKFFAQLIDFQGSLDWLFSGKAGAFAFPEKLFSQSGGVEGTSLEKLEGQLEELRGRLRSKALNSVVQHVLHSQKTFMADAQQALDFQDVFCVFVFLFLTTNTPIYNQTPRQIEHYKDYFDSGAKQRRPELKARSFRSCRSAWASTVYST